MAAPAPDQLTEIDVLERIQRRVLWLAISQIHYANRVRTTSSGVKVGGHQASSSSMTTIMTALYFHHLKAADRVSVKPHASPVLHAINYLLGRLDARYLTELRAFRGLQSYPSRTKDPDPVDFSTGSVGIGATATLWSAVASRYLSTHFDPTPGARHIALVGDAELDEGAIWESLVDPMVSRLGEVLWIVDLNRQSLDRVVPDIAAGRIAAMFDAAGWQCTTVKYGRRLRTIFERKGGDEFRKRIDEMSNEEYQSLLRAEPTVLRERLANDRTTRGGVTKILADLSDYEIAHALRDLGGHDLADLIDAFDRAAASPESPTVLFAYTIKAWGLPTQGHPANHSALLSTEEWEQLGLEVGADPEDPWAAFDPDSLEGRHCRAVEERLRRTAPVAATRPAVPNELGRAHVATESTQQAFGRALLDITTRAPELAKRMVTVSPDVASSTNLGAWINRVGVWNISDRADWFAGDSSRLLRWEETCEGQHIELGIAEGNLVGLLGELGATWSRDGEPLFPIGTLYDPFVTRALEPWSFGIYSGGQSILVGTPSGVTLAPEGGAHQSVITPSIGIAQPQCIAWEPAFAQDLEWTLLHALDQLGRPGGTSAYFRLSTLPIDQSIACVPSDGASREERRRQVLAGGYLLNAAARKPDVVLVAMGTVIPQVLRAARSLRSFGIEADVVCLTSADLVFQALQCRKGLQSGGDQILDLLFPADRKAPIVTVIDGHPHALTFVAGIHGVPTTGLGVHDFGQVGDVGDLHRLFGIDDVTIAGAAFDLIDEVHP